jgi:hypothetical protein
MNEDAYTVEEVFRIWQERGLLLYSPSRRYGMADINYRGRELSLKEKQILLLL